MEGPDHLVFVRHGQAETNQMKRMSEAGDSSAYTEENRVRHTASYRLTKKGREQMVRFVGPYIRNEFCEKGINFGRFITSEFNRTRESAGLLDLPGAQWEPEPLLGERDWSDVDKYPVDESGRKFMDFFRRRRVEPFFSTPPPTGESFKLLCLYARLILLELRTSGGKEPVIILCHGEVMRAIQVTIEQMTQERFRELTFSKDRRDIIFNGQIVHYTRRNPFDASLAPLPDYGWVRWIRPTETPVTTSGWREIKRHRYSNEELLDIVSRTPTLPNMDT